MAEGKELKPTEQQFLFDELRWYGKTIAGGGPMVGYGIVGRRAETHWYTVTLPALQTLGEVYSDHTTNIDRSGFVLGHDHGKAVQEVLNRYVGELRELDPGVIPDDDDRTAYSQQLAKDIDYITELAKLFD